MSEHDEQVKLFNWARYNEGKYPELEMLFAIPNAGKRPRSQGAWMVAEGLKRGVPDICLPISRGGYHALYIELKHGKNKATPNQKHWLEMLIFYGNLAIVCYEYEGARDALLSYLDMQPCGHPKSAIKGDGLTHWCGMCEDG